MYFAWEKGWWCFRQREHTHTESVRSPVDLFFAETLPDVSALPLSGWGYLFTHGDHQSFLTWVLSSKRVQYSIIFSFIQLWFLMLFSLFCWSLRKRLLVFSFLDPFLPLVTPSPQILPFLTVHWNIYMMI